MEPFSQQPSPLPNQPGPGYPGRVYTLGDMLKHPRVQQTKTFVLTNIQKPWGIAVAVVAGVLILAVIVGGVMFALEQSSPTATLQKYCDGEVHQNPSEVLSTMDSPGETEASIQEQFNAMQTVGEAITNCVVSSTQQDGSTAYGTVIETISLGGNIEQVSPEFALKLENGQWKIYGSL